MHTFCITTRTGSLSRCYSWQHFTRAAYTCLSPTTSDIIFLFICLSVYLPVSFPKGMCGCQTLQVRRSESGRLISESGHVWTAPAWSHKSHRRPANRLADRLGVGCVIFVALDVGLHVLRRHQTNLVPRDDVRTVFSSGKSVHSVHDASPKT
jgi:hypothetical protein